MAKDYSKFTRDELIKYIEELQAQLKSEKYGLYWDKNIEQENCVNQCKNNIPLFKRDYVREINIDSNNNLLIEGDNFHSLIALNYILEESIDLIYIDPPYNTGHQDFIYNDKFVDENDGFRHSKWLSWMEKRLELSRKLLKNEGIIFVSIDDNEQSNLKLLMDKIFGELNYIGMIIIQATPKNDPLCIATSHEYCLVYMKNKLIAKNYEWGESNEFAKILPNIIKKENNYRKAEELLKEYYKKEGLTKDNISNYKYVDEWGIFRIGPLDDPQSKGPKDERINPNTGRPCKIPTRGWGCSKETWNKWVENHEILFPNDDEHLPSRKVYLIEGKRMPMNSVFKIQTRKSTNLLKNIFGCKVFNHPKPLELIKKIISLTDNKDCVVLDFFAGSGTTGQAVLELNKEDGGNRRFILCTNNENNICTDVTYPRLKTVITGIRPDGTKYSEGIPANLIYYKTDFIKDSSNTDQAKYCLVEKVDELLCISEDIFIQLERNDYSSHYVSNDESRHMFIYSDYYNETKFKEFKQRVLSTSGTKVVYIFSSDNNVDETLFEGIKDVEVKPIPSKIYEIYKEIVEDIKRG